MSCCVATYFMYDNTYNGTLPQNNECIILPLLVAAPALAVNMHASRQLPSIAGVTKGPHGGRFPRPLKLFPRGPVSVMRDGAVCAENGRSLHGL